MVRSRILLALLIAAVLTPPLMLLQAGLLAARMPLARQLPVAFHGFLCRMIGVRIAVRGSLSPHRPLLVTSNHISWLDIAVISAVAPVSFIAKSEVRDWPVIGWLARLQRTVFVTREKRSQTAEVARHIAERLDGGDAMVLFPEGTTSDGNRIRRFRSALVGAAEALVAAGHDAAGVRVQPMAIVYTHINGLPLGRQHRPLIAWYGDQALGPHVWRLLCAGPVDVTVSFGEPIALAGNDRKQVTAAAQAAVGALFATVLHGHPAQNIVTGPREPEGEGEALEGEAAEAASQA